nr:bile acid:sodium symporter family protein [Sphingomonas sp. CDS-1]
MKLDFYLISIFVAIGLAMIAPGLGASDGLLHLPVVTSIGVSLVFFLHGAALAPQSLTASATKWKLHLLVQSSTFVLFPIIGFGIFLISRGLLPDELRLGIVYLSVLSSTISSSVALTALSGGNVAAAVFNATLSGLIGLFITPFLIGFAQTTAAGQFSLVDAIIDVAKTLLLPFVLGQLARPLICKLLAKRKKWVSMIDRTVIILIVYGAFCNATQAGIWRAYSPLLIAEIGVIVIALLVGALASNIHAARALGFSREDEAASVFCGTTKSLANGAPIASVLFAGNPNLAVILLPLVLYHLFQLVVCSALARRYAMGVEVQAGATSAG